MCSLVYVGLFLAQVLLLAVICFSFDNVKVYLVYRIVSMAKRKHTEDEIAATSKKPKTAKKGTTQCFSLLSLI